MRHGVYVSVMLSKPCPSAEAPEKAFGKDEQLLLETKHDGERIQLHLWRDPGPDESPTAVRVSLTLTSMGHSA